jgi:subtilisin family serine protease
MSTTTPQSLLDLHGLDLGIQGNWELGNGDRQRLRNSETGTNLELVTGDREMGTGKFPIANLLSPVTSNEPNLEKGKLAQENFFADPVKPIYTLGKNVSRSDIAPQSNSANQLMNLSEFRTDSRFAGIDGRGFTVVVLDTGIDRDHPFFGPDSDKNGIADRIVAQYDFAEKDADASDPSGHGSHISSLVASSDNQYTGVAPGANIIHLKVFEDDGGGSFQYVEEALQWVAANLDDYNIASVNLSFGDNSNYDKPFRGYGIDDEIETLASNDVAVVAAAGNNFYRSQSDRGVMYPAADPNVISVGAVYNSDVGSVSYGDGANASSTGPDRVMPISQRHETLTSIFAPGGSITGANADGGTMTLQGTSQAAAHVTGAIALAQQLAVRELGRRLSVSELENLLASTGKSIIDGDDERDNVENTGLTFKRIDINALGEAILSMESNNSPASANKVSPSSVTGEFGRNSSYDPLTGTSTAGASLSRENAFLFGTDAESNFDRNGKNEEILIEGYIGDRGIVQPNGSPLTTIDGLNESLGIVDSSTVQLI